VVHAGALPHLVALMREGTNDGKAEAACALCNIATDVELSKTVVDAGALLPLVQLLQRDDGGGGSGSGGGSGVAGGATSAEEEDEEDGEGVEWGGAARGRAVLDGRSPMDASLGF
jgi:hypothetical protein